MAPDMDFSGQKELSTVILDIYPGADGHLVLYEDDGKSFKYQQGEYAETYFESRTGKDSIEIMISPTRGNYNGKPPIRNYELHINGIEDAELNVNNVKLDSSRIHKISDPARKGIKVVIPATADENRITIQQKL